MGEIFNRKYQKPTRQYLRNNATRAEKILWKKLRNKQFFGFKFRRQHGIGPFIVDFYCPELRVVIEVDGPIHYTPEHQLYDRLREEYIEQFDLRIIRFTNSDIFTDVDSVIEMLTLELGRAEKTLTEYQ